MSAFPLIPLGQAIICRKSADPDNQKVVLPEKATVNFVVADVLSVGPGHYSEVTGQLIPCNLQAGDKVVFPKMSAMAITYGLRKHLIAAGLTDDELNECMVVNEIHVVAKFVKES